MVARSSLRRARPGDVRDLTSDVTIRLPRSLCPRYRSHVPLERLGPGFAALAVVDPAPSNVSNVSDTSNVSNVSSANSVAPVTAPVDVDRMEAVVLQPFVAKNGRPGLRADVGGLAAGGTLRAAGVGLVPATRSTVLASSAAAVAALASSEPHVAVGSWIAVQARENPLVKQVLDAMRTQLTAERPRSVRALFESGVSCARAALASTPFPDDVTRAHHEVMLATIAIAGQVLPGGPPGGASGQFPPFLPTGRKDSFDFDAAWHLSSHCLYATLSLFDARYGDGRVAAALLDVTNRFDSEGRAHEVFAAYDRVRGELRPLHPDVLDEYPDVAFHGWYFPRPLDLSEGEGRVWDAAVRTGDAYEHKGAGVSSYAAVTEGGTARGPTDKMDSTLGMFSGVKDPSVCVDITGNRVGAWLAVALMRDPSRVPEIPFDTPEVQALRPLEPPRKVSFAAYFAGESVQLALLDAMPGGGALSGGGRSLVRADHAAWAEQVGPAEALASLKEKGRLVVEHLAVHDRERLARFYGNLAIRHLAWRSALGTPGLENPSWDAHTAYGRVAPAKTLVWELGLRYDAIARLF